MAKKPPKRPQRPASFSWRPFLRKVSSDLLKDISIREDLPDDIVAAKWLGYDGASEEEIAALEQRLGKRLPPSYRSFLAETDGWRQCGSFIFKLWPASEVRWFRERNQDWIDAYVQAGPELEISDDEYLVYDSRQDSCRFRNRYLQSALEISDTGDSAVLLLNPEVVTGDGEWEAWFFANWLPGATRYRSFRELIESEHESFLQLFKGRGPGKSKYGNAGQRAACRGETGKALAFLRKAAVSGDISSTVSLAELCAFRSLWDEVIPNLGRVILNLGAISNLNGYPGHLLHLLARAGHETGRWDDISHLAAAAIAAEEQRPYDHHHQHVQNAFVTWFRNLQDYCRRLGQPPHELTRIFNIENPIDKLTIAERRAAFERADKDEFSYRLKSKPLEAAIRRFALALNLKLDDELLRIWETTPEAIYFNHALDVSRAYMRCGNPQAAWEVLRARMNQCVRGLPEQVAPIILLVDDTLRPLMTRERCEFILSTPRGREACKG